PPSSFYTDNGTEFRNTQLESSCDEKGISQNLSSPYTPEQNGVAERKNRTLIEAAKTMLNGSVLSKNFCSEAVRIACYKLCKQFEKPMAKKLEMSMMGELTYFLGLQIKQDDKGISIYQEQYIRSLLKKYEISDSSSAKTTMVPPNNLGPDLADYDGCNMDRKIISCACQILRGKLVCWSAKKQESVAMSSAEAEYVAAAGCCANIL
nr:retrovirus-related Pol polyprotein from transposon TNT 1-94 [Tanacetum cinerariifolium]